MYVYTYIYIYTYLESGFVIMGMCTNSIFAWGAHTYAMHACTCKNEYACLYVYISINIYIYIYIHTHTCIHIYVSISIYIYIYTQLFFVRFSGGLSI